MTLEPTTEEIRDRLLRSGRSRVSAFITLQVIFMAAPHVVPKGLRLDFIELSCGIGGLIAGYLGIADLAERKGYSRSFGLSALVGYAGMFVLMFLPDQYASPVRRSRE